MPLLLAVLAACHDDDTQADSDTDRHTLTDGGTDTPPGHHSGGPVEHTGGPGAHTAESGHTAALPEPVCPSPDVDLCGNGADDDLDGLTDCALEGDATAAWGSGLTLEAQDGASAGDADGDGDEDLVAWISMDSPFQRIAVSLFTPPFSPGREALEPAGTALASIGYVMPDVEVVDLDHDGTKDVLMGVGLVGASCDAAVPWEVYRFPVTALLAGTVDPRDVAVGTLRKASALRGTNAIYVHAIGDVNGNGAEDLLVLNSDCTDWRGYLVDSGAIVGTREVDQVAFATLEVGGPAPSRGLDVGDVDGDGTDDLAIAYVDGPGQSRVRLWSGGGLPLVVRPASAPRELVTSGASSFQHVLRGHDLTRDGRDDLVVVTTFDAAAVYVLELPLPPGTTDLDQAAWSEYEAPDAQVLRAEVADLNGDGELDLAIGRFDDGVRVDHAPCAGTRPVPADGASSRYASQFVLLDATGDGHEDVLITVESTPAPLLGWDVFPGGPR